MSDAHPLVRLETIALIGIGGFAGSNLRFFVDGLLADVSAVVLVNAVGSLALAVVVYGAEYAGALDRRTRLVLTTGFLSSLTTYSTFAVQTALAGDPLALGAVVAATYGLGLAGVIAGRAIARWLAGESAPGVERGGETT